MQKFLRFFVLMAMFALPFASNAQTSWTVADSTAVHAMVPLDFYNCDGSGVREAQMLYPASLLTSMNGSTLGSITFYHQNATATKTLTASTWYILIGETTETDLSSGFSTVALDTVYAGNLVVTSGVFSFDFTTPYTYNGGNLIVEILTTGATGNWFGSSNQGCYGMDSIGSTYSSMSTPNYTSFLPKTTFTEAPTCFPVINLAATSVTSTGLTLTWSDDVNSSATYTIYNMADTTVVASAISGTTYTISNLDANTLYTYGVAADCGGGDVASIATLSVRTSCATYTAPYTWDFEDMPTNAAPLCWNKVGTGSANVLSSTSNTHGGSNYLRFSGSTSNLVVLPEFSDDISDLQIRFWTRPESYTNTSCGTFSVGYVTDANDASTFVEMANYTYSDFSAYTEKTVYFTNAPMGARMAMRHNAGSSSWYWYVDDVTVEAVPNCVPVSGLTVSDITTTEATLNWIGNANGYTIYDMSDTSVYQYTTDTTVTLYALDPMTAYTFGVAANCGSDESSIVTISFATACTSIELPYTETFAETSGTRGCWNLESNNTNNVGGSNGMGFVTVNGRETLRFSSYSSASDYNQYGYSPLLSVSTDATNLNVRVVYATYGSSDVLNFGYITATDTVWDPTDYTTTGNSDFQSLTFVIPATATQLAVHYYGDYSYYGWIDSVVVTEMTGDYCAPVAALTIDSVSTTSVSLSWNSDANDFTVIDMADGSIVATSIVNNATITGLTAGTAYTFGVVVDCGSTTSDTVTIATMTQCENTCQITINGTDEYGDGWNGNAINVMQAGTLVGTFTLTTGDTYSTTFTVCSGIPVSFVWVMGSYPDEASFEIVDGGNVTAISIADGSTLTNGQTITTINDPCPSCVMPAVSVDAVTETSVTISWTGNATSYSIYNGSTYVANATANTYTFSGLTAGTAYTFGVVALCGADDSSAMATASATTDFDCSDITTLPYNYGFESGLGCWTTVNGSADGVAWYTTNLAGMSNVAPHGGSMVASSWSWNNASMHANAWLISPKFVLPTVAAGDSLTFSWWEAANANYADSYSVKISTTTNDTTAFTVTARPSTAAAGSWTQQTIDLTAYAGQSVYVAFHHVDYDMNYLLIDDIELYQGAYVPPAPDTLTVTVATMDATMGTTNPAPGTYQYAETETVQLAGVPNSGYHFTGWVYTTDGVNNDTLDADYISISFPASLFMSTGSVTFTALFEAGNPDSTTVTYAVNDATMGTIVPAPGTYAAYVGNAIQAEAIANNGYEVAGWVLGIYDAQNTALQEDTLYAFDEEFANPMNFGTVPQSFADNGYTITVTALFTEDTNGTTDEVFTLITAVNDATMGTITPAPGTHTYVAGDSILFDFTAAEGYTIGSVDMTMSFMDQTIMDTTLPALYAIAMAQEPLYADDFLGMTMSLTINFVADTNSSSDVFTLVTAVNDATMGTMTPAPGTHTYNAGDVVNFTVTANEGYAFESATMSISYMGMTVQEQTFYDLDFTTEPLEIDEEMLGFTMTVTVNFKSTQGIENADEVNVNAYTKDGNIILNGAEGREVYLFDINGRMLNHTATAAETEVYSVPASGVYLIKVDGVQTKRVVVIR